LPISWNHCRHLVEEFIEPHDLFLSTLIVHARNIASAVLIFNDVSSCK
jgi:hypothetical protein